MACNSCGNYQTYPNRKSCGGCGKNSIYFPDFVANACCNPCCESGEKPAGSCHKCNGGGCGSCGCDGFRPWNPWNPWYPCDSWSPCHPWNPWYPGQSGCCGACDCGCQDLWGCHNGICPR